MPEFTARQQRFVEELLIDDNATQAAIRAGYSAKTAQQHATRLMAMPHIIEAVAKARAERSERTKITADMVMNELARLGFSDIRGIFTEDGQLVAPRNWPDNVAASVASVEVVTKTTPIGDGEVDVEYVHKIKLWDKNSALEKLGKALGMFVERVEAKHTHAVDESVAGLMARIAQHGQRLVPTPDDTDKGGADGPADH